jgi:dipicolinate synthase subunit A
MEKTISVIGGDMRQIYLIKSLMKHGYNVKYFGFDKFLDNCEKTLHNAITGAFAIVLPVPVTTDGVNVNAPLCNVKISVSEIAAEAKDVKIIFGGKLNSIKDLFAAECFDYIEREEVSVMNAVPTAEGAIEIAINELPSTVFKMNCLITGYGRVSKALASRLKALGANVTVAARKQSDLAWIEESGYTPLCFKKLTESLYKFDCIFNTVPVRVFNKPELLEISEDTVIIDLASKPGGVDMEEAALLGKKVIWALSLPGKVAPKTSGEIIAKTVIRILEEEI